MYYKFNASFTSVVSAANRGEQWAIDSILEDFKSGFEQSAIEVADKNDDKELVDLIERKAGKQIFFSTPMALLEIGSAPLFKKAFKENLENFKNGGLPQGNFLRHLVNNEMFDEFEELAMMENENNTYELNKGWVHAIRDKVCIDLNLLSNKDKLPDSCIFFSKLIRRVEKNLVISKEEINADMLLLSMKAKIYEKAISESLSEIYMTSASMNANTMPWIKENVNVFKDADCVSLLEGMLLNSKSGKSFQKVVDDLIEIKGQEAVERLIKKKGHELVYSFLNHGYKILRDERSVNDFIKEKAPQLKILAKYVNDGEPHKQWLDDIFYTIVDLARLDLLKNDKYKNFAALLLSTYTKERVKSSWSERVNSLEGINKEVLPVVEKSLLSFQSEYFNELQPKTKVRKAL